MLSSSARGEHPQQQQNSQEESSGSDEDDTTSPTGLPQFDDDRMLCNDDDDEVVFFSRRESVTTPSLQLVPSPPPASNRRRRSSASDPRHPQQTLGGDGPLLCTSPPPPAAGPCSSSPTVTSIIKNSVINHMQVEEGEEEENTRTTVNVAAATTIAHHNNSNSNNPLMATTTVAAAAGGPQPSVNRLTAGGYKKLKLIGSGADGKVFQAILAGSGTIFAVKEVVITPNTRGAKKGATGPLALTDAEESRILTMRRQVDKLRTLPFHVNIVKHFGTERTTCALNVMMEYVEGGSIESFLKKLGPLSEGTVRHFTKAICHGLAFLHLRSIIHRDIKGANCLVNKQGTVKIADFGSCEMPEEAGTELQQTTRGKNQPLKGTSMWMAPEAIMQEEAVTTHADIWSLGCTVVEMATGRAPWYEARFTNEWAAMFHISQCGHGPPIPVQLSRQAHDFLSKCFEIDPAKRSTAEECLAHPFLMQDFDPASTDESMQPPLPSELQNHPKLPALRRSPSLDGATLSDDDSSTPSYGSIQSFAVYDHEMGDAEDDGYEEVLTSSNAPTTTGTPSPATRSIGHSTPERRQSDQDMAVCVVQRANGRKTSVPAIDLSQIINTIVAAGDAGPKVSLLQSGKQYTSLPAFGQLASSTTMMELDGGGDTSNGGGATTHEMTPAGGESTAPSSLMTTKTQMEINSGGDFMMDQVDSDSNTFDEIDEHGLGLPEPILFNVLHFLGAKDLCHMSMVKQSLHTFVNTGAREVLWRHLFIASFGDVDPVRDTLRTNWKDFYKNSTVARSDYQVGLTSFEDRKFFFMRQLCQSNLVFEGRVVEDGHGSGSSTSTGVFPTLGRVVIKVEKWAQSKSVDRRLVGASGTFGRASTPLESTPTRRRGPPSRQLSGLCKTPQVANYNANGSVSPDLLALQVSPSLRPSAPHASQSRLPPSGPSRRTPSSPATITNAMMDGTSGPFAINGSSPIKGLPPRTPRHVSPSSGLNPSSPYRLPRLGGGYVPPPCSGNPAPRPSLAALQAPSTAGANSGPNSYGLPSRQVRRRASGTSQHPKRSYQFMQPSGVTSSGSSSLEPSSSSLPPKPSSSSVGPPLARRGNTPVCSNSTGRGCVPTLDPNSQPTASSPGRTATVGGTPLVSMASSGLFVPPSSYGLPPTTRGTTGVNGHETPLQSGGGRVGGNVLSSPPPRTADRSLRPRELEGGALLDLCRAYDVPVSSTVSTVSRPDRSLVQHQYKLLKHLEYFNAKCIPRVYGLVESEQFRSNFLVTSGLGPSVHELLHLCGNQFSLQTVLRLGIRLVGCVEEIHERDVVHGNVTPRNILVGPPDNINAANSMFLVNFSHGHFFRNPKTHRPNTTGVTSITAERAQKQNEFLWFSSKFVQDRCTPAPRDDLISVLYVLCYLLHGSLPWMSNEGRKLSRVEMLKLKNKFPDVLQQAAETAPATHPLCFFKYLKTCHALRQNEIPDYPFFKSLFTHAMQEKDVENISSFDWSKMYPCET